MKLQGLSIIFGLIVIPMILVLTYFVQLQVDTIALQTEYDTKLLDATHDAMMAFELNTANEDLSSVADSLRTIIDASNNIFMNTLSTNHGLSNASKSRLEPFVPAILYTLYDGYYINSPTKTPEMATNTSGVVVEVNESTSEIGKFSFPGLKYKNFDAHGSVYIYDSKDETYYTIPTFSPATTQGEYFLQDFGQLLYKLEDGTYTTNASHPNIKKETKNVLKSYMPYSAKYVTKGGANKNFDISINYTLDNYLTVVGSIDNVYYTKSGYLINPNLVKSVLTEDLETSEIVDLLKYNENEAEEKIKSQIQNGKIVTLVMRIDGVETTINTGDLNSDETSAIIYYTKAKIFSDWIYKNLGNVDGDEYALKEKNIIEFFSTEMKGTSEKSSEELIYSFDNSENIIFDINVDPEDDSSAFVNHKYQVIKNSIQYNLNLAMSIYNSNTITTYQFSMPVISNDEWEKIINNVSIVSFLQGLQCGMKVYNNYAIVSSTNNELTVIPEEIYYTNRAKFKHVNTGDYLGADPSIYHRLDCPRLAEELSDSSIVDKNLTFFRSKEVKYDKVYDKNQGKNLYDHRALACYTCIIDGNYLPETLDEQRKKSYYLALGKERYKIYKMNAIKFSEGFEVIYEEGTGNDFDSATTRGLKEIKKIDITFGIIKSDDFSVNTVKFRMSNNHWAEMTDTEYVLNTNQTKEQTITINVKTDMNNSISYGDFFIDPNNVEPKEIVEGDYSNQIMEAIKCIKVTYK